MKALVLIADGIEELETVTVTDLLVRGGIQVTLASVNEITIKAARGLILTADCLIAEVTGDFDVVVCPGGAEGARRLTESADLKDLLLKRHHSRLLIAAICASPAFVLQKFGILEGITATCYPTFSNQIAHYVDQNVVVSGHIITSQGPGTAAQFALCILAQLTQESVAEQVAIDALYLPLGAA